MRAVARPGWLGVLVELGAAVLASRERACRRGTTPCMAGGRGVDVGVDAQCDHEEFAEAAHPEKGHYRKSLPWRTSGRRVLDARTGMWPGHRKTTSRTKRMRRRMSRRTQGIDQGIDAPPVTPRLRRSAAREPGGLGRGELSLGPRIRRAAGHWPRVGSLGRRPSWPPQLHHLGFRSASALRRGWVAAGTAVPLDDDQRLQQGRSAARAAGPSRRRLRSPCCGPSR